MPPRFLQLHTLTSYPASLLNRDDVGFAKRIPFGGVERVRISSQCLKRHWRRADDENALDRIPAGEALVPMSIRSRRTFESYIFEPLRDAGIAEAVARAVTEEVITSILPEGKQKQAAKEGEEPEGEPALRTAQVTVIGRPEMDYLFGMAREAAEGAENEKEARERWKEAFKGDRKKNIQALARGAGLDAALFGRMVTGDALARCDAAVHVAHAFTVHPGAFETDYFSAVDDLQPREETGSGHINTAELTTGLYYGYVVVDLPLLVSNLEGCPRVAWIGADRSLAAEVVRRLVHLIATISPGAKQGATAPYSLALAVLAEMGDAQPRTLANAYLDALRDREHLLRRAQSRLAAHLQGLDGMYGRSTRRRLAAAEPTEDLLAVVDGQETLAEVADWSARELSAA